MTIAFLEDRPRWKRNKYKGSSSIREALMLLDYLDEKGKDKKDKDKKDDKKSGNLEMGNLIFALVPIIGPALLIVQLHYLIQIAELLHK